MQDLENKTITVEINKMKEAGFDPCNFESNVKLIKPWVLKFLICN